MVKASHSEQKKKCKTLLRAVHSLIDIHKSETFSHPAKSIGEINIDNKDRLGVETDCLVAVLVWISGLGVSLDQRSYLRLHRARLEVKCVTVCRQINHSVCNRPPGSTQPR